MDPVLALVRLQAFDGSFPASEQLGTIVGKDALAEAQTLQVPDNVWATVLAVSFLKKNMKKKMIVFFSSCNSVKYHAELLNYIDVPVLDLHVRSFSILLGSPCSRRVAAQTKAAKANNNLLRVLQRRVGNTPLYGRRRARVGYPASRLDHPV